MELIEMNGVLWVAGEAGGLVEAAGGDEVRETTSTQLVRHCGGHGAGAEHDGAGRGAETAGGIKSGAGERWCGGTYVAAGPASGRGSPPEQRLKE